MSVCVRLCRAMTAQNGKRTGREIIKQALKLHFLSLSVALKKVIVQDFMIETD